MTILGMTYGIEDCKAYIITPDKHIIASNPIAAWARYMELVDLEGRRRIGAHIAALGMDPITGKKEEAPSCSPTPAQAAKKDTTP